METYIHDWKATIRGSNEGTGAAERIKAVLASGVSPHAVSKYGKTMLHAATTLDNPEALDLALGLGVPIDARAYPVGKGTRTKTTFGWTALHYAARQNGLVRPLIEAGASEQESAAGETALAVAMRFEAEDAFWTLVATDHVGVGSRRDRWNAAQVSCWERRQPPESMRNFLARVLPQGEHTRWLERSILDVFHPGAAQWPRARYCGWCREAGKNCDPARARVWRETEERMATWKGNLLLSDSGNAESTASLSARGVVDGRGIAHRDDIFTYGFVERCVICRRHVVPLPRRFYPGPSARGVMVSEKYLREGAGLLAQKWNQEEDIFCLLNLRKELTVGTDKDANEPPRYAQDSDSRRLEASLLLPKYWLLRCLKDHQECQSTTDSNLPTRLVHITATDARGTRIVTAKIVTTSPGRKGTYCTLSYRWQPRPLVLNSGNLRDFHQSLPISLLPVTIQEALSVAARLGFQFIWVDSLCILQDSLADWKAESQKMCHIYANSTLNIAAVDTYQGGDVFRQRPIPWDHAATSKTDRKKGHLDTRGWVLQEEVLSKRQLSFTEAGVFWTCSRWNCSEHAPLGTVHRDGPRSPSWTAYDIKLRSANMAAAYKLWHRLIEDYNSRHFTKEPDRILALRGLEIFFGDVLADRHLFCLWEKDPMASLFWRHAVKEVNRPGSSWGFRYWTERIRQDDDCSGQQPLQCPSWSWLSAKPPIQFPLDSQRLFEDKLKIVHVSITESRNGIAGYIIIEGPLLPVRLHGEKFSMVRSTVDNVPGWQRYEPGFYVEEKYIGLMDMPGPWIPDEDRTYEGQGWILAASPTPYCLVLDRVDGDGANSIRTFKRIGWGTLYAPSGGGLLMNDDPDSTAGVIHECFADHSDNSSTIRLV